MAKTKTPAAAPVDEKLLALRKELVPLRERLARLRITTQQQYDEADSGMAALASWRKSVDAYFDPDIKAAKALAKSLRDKKDKETADADLIESAVRPLMSQWLTAQLRKAEAQQAKKIERAMAKGDTDAVALLQEAKPAVGGANSAPRKQWYAEVTDAKLVPAEYFIGGVACGCAVHIDMQRLDAAARNFKELFAVPGAKANWRAGAVIHADGAA